MATSMADHQESCSVGLREGSVEDQADRRSSPAGCNTLPACKARGEVSADVNPVIRLTAVVTVQLPQPAAASYCTRRSF